MRDLLCGGCLYFGQPTILRAIRIVADYLLDEEFPYYSKGTTLLEEDDEDILWAANRLGRFVVVIDRTSSLMARGVRIGRDDGREGDERK